MRHADERVCGNTIDLGASLVSGCVGTRSRRVTNSCVHVSREKFPRAFSQDFALLHANSRATAHKDLRFLHVLFASWLSQFKELGAHSGTIGKPDKRRTRLTHNMCQSPVRNAGATRV